MVQSTTPKSIRDMLRDAGITIKDVATFAEVSRTSIYRWIDDYDRGEHDGIRCGVLALFNHVKAHPGDDKRKTFEAMLSIFGEENRKLLLQGPPVRHVGCASSPFGNYLAQGLASGWAKEDLLRSLADGLRSFADALDERLPGSTHGAAAAATGEVRSASHDHHSYYLHVGARAIVRLALKTPFVAPGARIGLPWGRAVRVGSIDELAHRLDADGQYGCWSLKDKGAYYLVVDFDEDDPEVMGVLQSCPKGQTIA